MIVVRTNNGRSLQLQLNPPLRLRLRPEPNASTLPGDITRRIFSFLTARSEDWLAADSSCSSWNAAALPLWKGSRSGVVCSFAASRRVGIKWKKLEGFLDRKLRFSLCGPVTDDDLQMLKEAVQPWVLPFGLVASLKVHDGELNRGPHQGMYFGSRLLSAREMSQLFRTWQQLRQSNQTEMVRLPLFSPSGARQVAIELSIDHNDAQHGKVILISPSVPYAPHFKILACNWENFLTLV
mmetsp:Transcript_13875/g.20476  ORF Transcript_13875/g.20476 Transcript_13875/m.20476 type:complete len:238 (-) Transcript_13875:111-824(-)